jgi:hypothetical protein
VLERRWVPSAAHDEPQRDFRSARSWPSGPPPEQRRRDRVYNRPRVSPLAAATTDSGISPICIVV